METKILFKKEIQFGGDAVAYVNDIVLWLLTKGEKRLAEELHERSLQALEDIENKCPNNKS